MLHFPRLIAPAHTGVSFQREHPCRNVRLHAIAAAVVLCAGLAQMGNAHAVEFGRVLVQSAVGSPLRAEVDMSDITPSEAATLRVRLASAEAFRAAGLVFNPVLAQAQVSLQQRSDGRSFLRLTTAEPVTEPFMDLVLEAQWASGRSVRNYTLLLNKPARVSDSTSALASATTSSYEAKRTQVIESQPAQSAPRSAPSRGEAENPGASDQIQVMPGDTASRIAATFRPPSASLDQMLLAMYRNNPHAFLGNNVNRIKAGALLSIPEDAQAQAIDPTEARRIIAAQSKDFNAFRRRLAGQAPSTAAGDDTDRSASGRVQTDVLDQRNANPATDKLTLSKGSVAAQTEEARIALQQQAQEAAARATELSRNLDDLTKIQEAATAANTSTQTGDSANPGQSGMGAALGAGKVSALVASVMESPLLLPVAGGLLALLAGAGFWMARRRGSKREFESAHAHKVPGAEPYLGNSHENLTDVSPPPPQAPVMPVTPDPVKTGDVDPVAEADVYLAYGRDLQAEEILKEALSRQPNRLDVHIKLLSVYAKRRDVESFQALVMQAHALTKGTGPEWARICEMGRELDAKTPLYSPVSTPVRENIPNAQAEVRVSAGGNAPVANDQPGAAPAQPTTLELNRVVAQSSAAPPAPVISSGAREFSAGQATSPSKSTLSPFINRTFVGITPELTPKPGPSVTPNTPSDGVGRETARHEEAVATRSPQKVSEPDDALQVDWDALNLDIDIESPPSDAPGKNSSK